MTGLASETYETGEAGEMHGTSKREIIVVGLGPGRWEDLTIEARGVLEAAPLVVFRTLRHPTVEALRARRPELAVESFDALYEHAESFATLYPQMTERLYALAAAQPPDQPLVYAVPGHPLIAEESVRTLRAGAAEHGVTIRLVPGLSFIEPVSDALEIDPLARDMQLVDATQLAGLGGSPLTGALLPTHPLLIAQAYNRRLLSGIKLALQELYPEDWEVAVVRWAGLPEQTVERVPLVELDRGERADHLTTIYVPPLAPLAAVRVSEGLRYVTQRLRAPDGCPWDREQTHQSLRRYVIEEAYEVAEILDEWEGTPEQAEHLAEELGDLLLQVYLQSEIADQEDLFHIGDVYQAVTEKLIRRHPHVFGEVEVRDSAHVLRNWEAIKRQERAAKGADVQAESALHGVPKSLPALLQAYELDKKAAKVGFDWPEAAGALAKVEEEARELAAARGNHEEQEAELGDLLFALVALARHLKLHPEDALRAANTRFRWRFEAMEARAQAEGRALESLSLDEWLALWNAAKAATA
jgi:tetrapyrrole methylase family protein / MazG family protein